MEGKATPLFIGQAMCDALGLDSNSVLRLELNIGAHEAEVIVHMWPSAEHTEKMAEVIKRYRLVPEEETEVSDDG